MTASILTMMRFAASCVVAAIVASGVVPCTALVLAAAPVSHECCAPDCHDAVDMPNMPDMPATMAVTESPAPRPAPTPADCCVVSTDARVPPAAPASPARGDLRVDARVMPVALALPVFSLRFNDRDARALSAPRPLRLSVLLI